MTRHWPFAVGLLGAIAVALLLRVPRLCQRPFHGDEAVHVLKFEQLWQQGTYTYDPHEYHGPSLYYLTLPAIWLSGVSNFANTSEAHYRALPVVAGVGLILLLALWRDGWGTAATLIAAGLTAVSPMHAFFSRYYIQETLLVVFTFLLLVAGWRYARSGRWGWLLLAGAALGLIHATKETCIIALGCLAVALAVTLLIERPGRDGDNRRPMRWWAVLAAVGVAALVSTAFYAAFGTHLQGVVDGWRAWPTYFQRAGGQGLHDHPWHYYLRMVLWTHNAPGPVWSEAFIVGLAAVGAFAALVGRGLGTASRPLARYVAVYVVLMTVVYSAIPYKTPWCFLGPMHGMVLLAGLGAVALVRGLRWWPLQGVAVVALVAGAGQLACQAERTCLDEHFVADRRNPYVYAHPVRDVVRLGERVDALAALHADGQAMVVKVISPDYWPLPWYLRRMERVGYWDDVPADPVAPVVITTPGLAEAVDAHLPAGYVSSYYGLRPERVLLLYVEPGLWARFIETQQTLREVQP